MPYLAGTKTVVDTGDSYFREISSDSIAGRTHAIKFTNSGGTVTIKAELSDNHIEIAVIDTGIGIPLEHQYKLFRLDVNYSRVGTEKEVSTGLGLILCKEFVEKHNGKIWFESEVEKGSIFKVKLPVKQNNI